MITTIKYSSVVYSKEENIKYMKNYDNYFLPVDNMEEAKRYYEEILGLKKKFDFSDKGMVAYNIGNEEPAIILKGSLKNFIPLFNISL